MIVAWFSRQRECRADAVGAELSSRNAMIAALQRLKKESAMEVPTSVPDAMQAFGISNGFGKSIMRAFATHPPLDVRINALQQG